MDLDAENQKRCGMTGKHWGDLGPSLVLGAGILISTLLAVRTAPFGRWVLSGPLFLALTVVGADLFRSRLQGRSSSPSWAALLLGGAFLSAGAIVALREPRLVTTLLPITGSAAWVTLVLRRPEGGCEACRGI
jgi:hypothetical protein